MINKVDIDHFWSVIEAGITPRMFKTEEVSVAHIDHYVSSFGSAYNIRSGEGNAKSKTRSSRLLDVEMLRASQDSLLCRSCVVSERGRERKVDESALRNIVDKVTDKTKKSEIQKQMNKHFRTKQKNNHKKYSPFH